MSSDLSSLLAEIEAGRLPSIILIGGDNEYLVSHAWETVRDLLESRPGTPEPEVWGEGSDLARVAESFRTGSLFGGDRLLIVSDVNAFVTRKELDGLVAKAVRGWESAKTDRKRKSSLSKLMHALGLSGATLDDSDDDVLDLLGSPKGKRAIREMLRSARETGVRETRGEDDAAILSEMVSQGGADGASLLLRTGQLPDESSTLSAIEKSGGMVVRCDLDRAGFDRALSSAAKEVTSEWKVRIEPAALSELRERLGIDRILSDKWAKDLPDLSTAVGEMERLAALVGEKGVIDAALVSREVAVVGGGKRYEIGSQITEGQIGGAIEKLRAIVEQLVREEKNTTPEVAYGRMLFPVADEVRQLLAIAAWCRLEGQKRSMSYNVFKGSLFDELSSHLSSRGIISKKPHPFVLYKKFEAITSGRFSERSLVECLRRLSLIEMERKSGGAPVDIGLESAILSLRAS